MWDALNNDNSRVMADPDLVEMRRCKRLLIAIFLPRTWRKLEIWLRRPSEVTEDVLLAEIKEIERQKARLRGD